MISARLDVWFTVFIIVIWALSAFLEFQRKKKLEEQRRQQKKSPPPTNIEELEAAEREVRQQPYQPVPVGRDLEVLLDDLFDKVRPPEAPPPDDPMEREIAKEIAKEISANAPLQVQLPAAAEPALQGLSEEVADINLSAITDDMAMEDRTRTIKEIFPGGVTAAIVASEVLAPPISRRKDKSRAWI